jgi:SAM-dependent methyltransferase
MKGYQNVVVEGLDYGRKVERKNSEFFNEGKWNNFIKPFLPKENCGEMTFIDFGCNYGLHLKLAKEYGFKNVLGIEVDSQVCKIAERYSGVNVINKDINIDLNLNDLPAADFILLSNFHYHIYTFAFLNLLNIMKRRTRYVIIVSAEDCMSRLYRAKGKSNAVLKYFKDYKYEDKIKISAISDPSYRDMYSMLFSTNIKRMEIEHIKNCFGKHGKEFYSKVILDKSRVENTYPLLLRKNGSLLDGHHRMATLEKDKYKTALCEVIDET